MMFIVRRKRLMPGLCMSHNCCLLWRDWHICPLSFVCPSGLLVYLLCRDQSTQSYNLIKWGSLIAFFANLKCQILNFRLHLAWPKPKVQKYLFFIWRDPRIVSHFACILNFLLLWRQKALQISVRYQDRTRSNYITYGLYLYFQSPEDVCSIYKR